MNYTQYTNMTTEELLTVAFTSPEVSPLTLELAQRLVRLAEEVDDLCGNTVDLDEQLAMIEELREDNQQLRDELYVAESKLAEALDS